MAGEDKLDPYLDVPLQWTNDVLDYWQRYLIFNQVPDNTGFFPPSFVKAEATIPLDHQGMFYKCWSLSPSFKKESIIIIISHKETWAHKFCLITFHQIWNSAYEPWPSAALQSSDGSPSHSTEQRRWLSLSGRKRLTQPASTHSICWARGGGPCLLWFTSSPWSGGREKGEEAPLWSRRRLGKLVYMIESCQAGVERGWDSPLSTRLKLCLVCLLSIHRGAIILLFPCSRRPRSLFSRVATAR